MILRQRCFGILLLILGLAGLLVVPVKAEPAAGWVPDARVPGYLDDTFTPILVADRNRTVHAFASQWVENDGRRKAVVYRQWTMKGGWTRPVDILLAPRGDVMVLGVYLDASDVMHLLITYPENNIRGLYYAFAPAEKAASAGAWSLPIRLGGPLALESAAIAGADGGHLVVIYSGSASGNGVYALTSSDSGRNWSAQTAVYLTYDTDLIPNALRLVTGKNEQIRAAWNVVTSLGVDKLLFYDGYDVQDAAWSNPIQLDRQLEIQDYFGPSFPAMVDTGKQVVIMYNGGNPFTDRPVEPGRPVQQVFVSSDEGETWNGPTVPFPYHLGRSGEHALELDGAGIPHALFVQRIESRSEQGQYIITAGIWHSSFEAKTWTKPERFVTTFAPHDLHAVVSQGNVLLVTWREDPGRGEQGIWFSYLVLDLPELPVIPLSTVQPEAGIQPTMTGVPDLSTPTPIPVGLLNVSSPSAGWRSNPGFALFAGVLPVFFLLIAIIAAARFFSARRS